MIDWLVSGFLLTLIDFVGKIFLVLLGKKSFLQEPQRKDPPMVLYKESCQFIERRNFEKN